MGSPAPSCERRDSKLEYARAVAARTRLGIAIDALQAAKAEVSVTIGDNHSTTIAIAEALQQARVAAAKLDINISYLGRIP